MADELNLETILKKERLPELSQVGDDFYGRAAMLIQELEAELTKMDPESIKYGFMKDRLDTAKARLRSILDLRLSKIVGQGALQAAKKEKSGELETLTSGESELYGAMVSLISEWRNKTFDQFAKKREKKEVVQQEPVKEQAKRGLKKEYLLLRMLQNVPTFVGMDLRHYTLAKEDVAMVPAVNAKALTKRKAAVLVSVGGNAHD